MTPDGLARVLDDRRLNAALSWLLIVVLAGVAVESWLEYDLLWAWFTTAVIALAMLPPVAFRRWTVTVPWEVLALGALPIIGWAWDTPLLLAPPLMYLSLGTVALILAVELDAFTDVELTEGFAVVFVAVATIGIAGVMAIGQWLSDRLLGTAFITTHDQLMQGFVAATGAGIVAGVLFAVAFRRLARDRVGGGAADAAP